MSDKVKVKEEKTEEEKNDENLISKEKSKDALPKSSKDSPNVPESVDKNLQKSNEKLILNTEGIPILNIDNYNEWEMKIEDKLRDLKFYHYLENDIKLIDLHPSEIKPYEEAREIFKQLLLSTTEKADQELVKSKSNLNIGEAWNELRNKYDHDKVNRIIKAIDNLLSLKLNPNESKEQSIKKFLFWSRIISKNIDNVNGFIYLLAMNKFNDIHSKKYKFIKEFLDKKSDLISFGDVEENLLKIDKKGENITLDVSDEESISKEVIQLDPLKNIDNQIKNSSFDMNNPRLNVGITMDEYCRLNLDPSIITPQSHSEESKTKSIDVISLDDDNTFSTIRNLAEYRLQNSTLRETNFYLNIDKKSVKDGTLIFYKLPLNVLQKIFFLLKAQEIITFINAHRKCYVLMNDLLNQTIITNQKFETPFFRNLFFSKQYIDHRRILTVSTVWLLHNNDYFDISNQIKKFITNEFDDLDKFPFLEHLEIINPSGHAIRRKLSGTSFKIELKRLEILNITMKQPKSDCVLIVDSPNLMAIKLINNTNIKFSNPSNVSYLDIDVCHKIIKEFTNLIGLSCGNFLQFKTEYIAFKKDSKLKEIKIVNASLQNLKDLFQLKKSYKLNKLSIYVQGVKIDGPHQKIIMQDLTVYCGEMRIYFKYKRRLFFLNFLTSLFVNFNVQTIDTYILDMLINIEDLKINFEIRDRKGWVHLLKASRILKKITLLKPIEQIYLNLIPEYGPNCSVLYLMKFDDILDTRFISQLRFLKFFQIKKTLNIYEIVKILHYHLKYLNHIRFDYRYDNQTNYFDVRIIISKITSELSLKNNFENVIIKLNYKDQINCLNATDFILDVRSGAKKDWIEFFPYSRALANPKSSTQNISIKPEL